MLILVRMKLHHASRPAYALVAALAMACTPHRAPKPAPPPASEAPADVAPVYFEPPGAQPARALNSTAPRYPDALRTARVEGEVLVSFVVDTSGLVLPGSMRVTRPADTLFVQAVRESLASARFAPATLNGRPVRQLVQQPYFFDVSGSATSAARKPLPASRPTTDSTARGAMRLPPVVVMVR